MIFLSPMMGFLHIERQIASSLYEQGNETGVACPSLLRHGLFTAGAFDNLDHNPSSTKAKDSFQVLLMQHLVS